MTWGRAKARAKYSLISVALRGILPANVWATIIKLCAFLNTISHKAIDPSSLSRLQEDVIQSLVSLEMIFSPSFFNIMTHLLVHLVKEIGILGPVFLHNMFPFERYFAVLKKYIHNRARPEGSIAKGYVTEWVLCWLCGWTLPNWRSSITAWGSTDWNGHT